MNIFDSFWILFPPMIALLWGITLLFNSSNDNLPKRWLSVFMFTVFVLYICHALVFFEEYKLYFDLKFLYHLTALSVYPLFYNYIQLMTTKEKVRPFFLIHLFPAIIVSILFLVFSYAMSPQEIAMYIQQVVSDGENIEPDKITFSPLLFIYKLSRIIFAFQSIAYSILCLRLIHKYNTKINEFYSNTEGKKLNTVKVLIYIMLSAGIVSFIFNFIGRKYFVCSQILVLPSLIFSSILYLIGFIGNRQVLRDVAILDENTTDKKEDSENENHPKNHSLIKELDLLIQKEQLYLDSNLKITDVSRKLGINRTYVSQLINTEYNTNFNNFINQQRIDYAQKMLNDEANDELTLSYIAEMSGFGSISTFNRNFKKNVGKTPQEYRERKKH